MVNGVSTGFAGLHVRDKFTSLGDGHDEDTDKLINNLNLATGQDLQQRQAFASLDQTSSDGLHEAFDIFDSVFFLGIPRARQEVF